jgi:hypothetical protein
MFGKTDAYLKAFAPKADPPHEEPPSSSLAPTQFEELFGEGAEPLLQDVLERPDVFTKDQQDLAMAILGGTKSVRGANNEDRSHLNEIAQQLAFLKPPAPQAPATIPRPAYVRTRAEMENFEEEYQPPPEKRDWPISPDDPEGSQG